MASYVKNQLRIKTVKAKNNNAKYRLVYKQSYGRINDNSNLSYSYSKSVSLSYKDQ